MKKLHLLGTVCALTFFAMNSSPLSAIVVSDDTSIASTGQSYAQTLASSSFSASAPTLDVLGDSGQTEPYKIFRYSMDSTLPVARHHDDSNLSLWLLLSVAAVFGVLSEVCQSIM